jgi:hypothetical protein
VPHRSGSDGRSVTARIYAARFDLEAIKKRRSGHENSCARVFHGKAQTRIWPSGIQWHICSTSAHNAESSDDPVERPFHADGHSAAGHDAKLHQMSSKPICPAIKLFIT